MGSLTTFVVAHGKNGQYHDVGRGKAPEWLALVREYIKGVKVPKAVMNKSKPPETFADTPQMGMSPLPLIFQNEV